MCHAAVFFHLRPLDGNPHLSQMHSWAPLQVLHGDADVLFPVSGVGSYSPAGGCSWFLPRCIHALCRGVWVPSVGRTEPGGTGLGAGDWKGLRVWLLFLLTVSV